MVFGALSIFSLAVGGCVLALLGLWISQQLSWSRKIPGPIAAKYTRWWYMWQIYSNDFHWTNIKLHRQNGKIVQIMPGYFTIDDPGSHKIIYGHSAPWIKGEFYDAWNVGPNPSLTNLFTERKPAHHASMRRKVAAMYTMTAMISYEPYVERCIELLHEHFTKFANTNEEVNLGHWFQCFAFDTVALLTFGKRLGFLDNGQDVENLIKNINYDHHVLSYLSVYPWITPTFKKLTSFFSGAKVLFFMQFAAEQIYNSKKDKTALPEHGPIYMVKKFLAAQRKDGPNAITDWDISANAGANIGAGSDTTGSALSTIVYYLYRDPAVLQRVRKEIETFDLSSRPTFQEVQKMPYLQAVIKEAFRVQPGVALPLWREVPRGGAVVAGQFFPDGTNLAVNIWVNHHNRSVYGPDADEFRPDRWLEAEAEGGHWYSAMEQNLTPFGLGSRTCIGKNISLLELNKVVPVLVRDFDFDFLGKDGSLETRNYLQVSNKWFIKLPHFRGRVLKRAHPAM